MSSFTGKFREYPSISADNFEKGNLNSVAFFLSHCHKDHMSGLNSSAFHQRLKESQNVFVYCSETTRNLLLCDSSYDHLKDYIRSIPMEQQTMVPLVNDDTGESDAVCITLLPAGHCVGSVMFLFEGHHGNVLYTGDFRLAKGDAKRISFFHSNGSVKDIKSIYIDTTFCLPKMASLPSRKQSRDAIIEIMDKWFSRGPGYVVSLLCKGMYGFEYLLKEVAVYYKTKIHVSVERLAMYECLPDMTPYFTTDGKTTRIHACTWKNERDSGSDLPCGSSVHLSLKTRVLRIKPTSMWVARDSEPMPADFKRYNKARRMWRVAHSMHASMEEIVDLVGYLRPYHVYPNVPPAGLDTLEDAFQRLKGLTRLQECDSCNQEESDEIHFREEAGHFADAYTESKEETEKRKLLEIARPAPHEQVLAQCKELGLEEEASSAPPPKRRRNRTNKTVVIPEEKAAIALQKSPNVEQVNSAGVELTGLQGSHRDLEKHDGKCQSFHKSVEHNSEDVVRTETSYPTGTTVSSLQLRKRSSISETSQTKDLETECSLNYDDVSLCRIRDKSRFPFENDSAGHYVKGCPLTTPRTPSKHCRNINELNKLGAVSGSLPEARTNINAPLPQENAKRPFPDKRGRDCGNSHDDSRKVNEPLPNKLGWVGRDLPGVISELTLPPSLGLIESPENKQGTKGGDLSVAVTEFNVPPSPGQVEPLPNKLFLLHKLLKNGETLSSTKALKF